MAEHGEPAFAFETPRLRLRPLCGDDEALYCELYTDAQTMQFIAPPLAPERAARSFRKAVAMSSRQPLEKLFLVVIEKASQQSLGICGIGRFDAGRMRAEVGILLRSPARAQGFAREGLAALVARVFSVFCVDEIWVECWAGYADVERMVSSIGFTLCEGAAGEGNTGPKRIWSVHRASWCFSGTIQYQGEERVERHRLS